MERLADDLRKAGLTGFARREARHRTEVFRRQKTEQKRRSEQSARPMPRQVLQIRTYWAQHAGDPKRLSQHEVGQRYGVHNDGRVSEILRGDKNGRPIYSISGYYIPPKLRKLNLEK